MSHDIRKPTKCLGENKGADQLCNNCTADQRLCFRYTVITTPLLLKSKISSLYPFSVTVQAGLCRTWCNNCTADQRLCFRYTVITSPLLLISKISSFYPFSVTVQAGLCQTWSEPKVLVFSCTGSYFFVFQKSDPAGLLVMERCAVELDLNEQQNFSFVIGKTKMN